MAVTSAAVGSAAVSDGPDITIIDGGTSLIPYPVPVDGSIPYGGYGSPYGGYGSPYGGYGYGGIDPYGYGLGGIAGPLGYGGIDGAASPYGYDTPYGGYPSYSLNGINDNSSL